MRVIFAESAVTEGVGGPGEQVSAGVDPEVEAGLPAARRHAGVDAGQLPAQGGQQVPRELIPGCCGGRVASGECVPYAGIAFVEFFEQRQQLSDTENRRGAEDEHMRAVLGGQQSGDQADCPLVAAAGQAADTYLPRAG